MSRHTLPTARCRPFPLALLVALLLAGLLPGGLLTATPAAAQTDATALGFGTGAADTLRTNLWLVEALMREVVTMVARRLPPPPAGVLLTPLADRDAEQLFTEVAAEVLVAHGYEVYLGAEDEAPDAIYAVEYRAAGLTLDYPATGRRLGIWREWVARDLELHVQVTESERASGRLLYSDTVVRSFRDRVPAEHFAAVESDLYPFTHGKTQESGWQRRLEEIVVLGTLVGLVAVYFANTQ